MKKGVLKKIVKFEGKHLCWSFFFNSCKPEACSFIKKETNTWMFPCEFCKIFKNTF